MGSLLETLNNYTWTILKVRIIGAIKRQFFHMVTHIFNNSDLTQETFAINTYRAVIYSLGHSRKHMLPIIPTIWRPGFTTGTSRDKIIYKVKKGQYRLT